MSITAALLIATLGQQSTTTFNIQGSERKAIVIAPTKPNGAPVIFAFHGHGGNMRNAQRSFLMEKEWPEAIVIYMEGLPTASVNDPAGAKNGWQTRLGAQNDRDLAFFDAVWKKIKTQYKPDEKRVFAMGHSNGGRFTYLLWAERPSIFKSFAPSGSPSSGLKLSPKPAFHALGETDQIVNPENQKRTVEGLKEMNGCEKNGKIIAEYTTLYKGKNGNDIETYIHPGGHNYPKIINKHIVDFWKSLK